MRISLRRRLGVAASALGLALAIGGAFAPSASAANEGVCPEGGGWTGHMSAGNQDEFTYTAPDGFLVDMYCVKAGSINQGNGPEIVDVEPDAESVTFSHSSGKDISHFSILLIVDEEDDPCDDEGPLGEDCDPCDDVGDYGAECDPCDDVGEVDPSCEECPTPAAATAAAAVAEQVPDDCFPCDEFGDPADDCDPCDEFGDIGDDCDPCDEFGDIGDDCDPCDEFGPVADACTPPPPPGFTPDPVDPSASVSEDCAGGIVVSLSAGDDDETFDIVISDSGGTVASASEGVASGESENVDFDLPDGTYTVSVTVDGDDVLSGSGDVDVDCDEVLGEVVTPPVAPVAPTEVAGVVQTPPAAAALPRTGSENQLLALLAGLLLLGGGSMLYASERFSQR